MGKKSLFKKNKDNHLLIPTVVYLGHTNFFFWKKLCRAHDILSRAHDLLSRAHDIISRAHDIISRAHDIISRAHNIIYRAHDIISRAHDLIIICIWVTDIRKV